MKKAFAIRMPWALMVGQVFAFVLASNSMASASTSLGFLGNDARASAMGGGSVAVGRGPSLLLRNPALMPFAKGGVWLGFDGAGGNLSITPDPRGDDFLVPEGMELTDPKGWLGQQPVPSVRLAGRSRTNTDLGGSYLLHLVAISSFDVPGLRVGLGLSTPVPNLVGFDVWYNDEREQFFSNKLHFERVGEWDEIFAIYPAISYSPVDWFSFGAALKVGLAMGLDVGMYVSSVNNLETPAIAPIGEVTPAVQPIAGVAFRLPIGLQFGATYTHEAYVDIGLNVDVQIADVAAPSDNPDEVPEPGTPFKQKHRFVLGYEPISIAAAVGYEKGPFSAEVVATLELWSRYLDKHGNDWFGGFYDPQFQNIVNVRAGLEWQAIDLLAVRAGFAYLPSPMPEMTGRYNYVDNDVVRPSLGAGLTLPLGDKVLTVDLALALLVLRSMTVYKNPDTLVDEIPDNVTDSVTEEPWEPGQGFQTNNPGYPGFSFGGVVLHGGLTVGLLY
ncbi:MAG: hypothetical protein MUC50_01250 [Myxococcota bacterium]|nr:hypothetical protein [Myxococcota bacterium]